MTTPGEPVTVVPVPSQHEVVPVSEAQPEPAPQPAPEPAPAPEVTVEGDGPTTINTPQPATPPVTGE